MLKSVAVSAEEARGAVRARLTQEKAATYVQMLQEQLRDQAAVRIFEDRLPPAAQAALSGMHEGKEP